MPVLSPKTFKDDLSGLDSVFRFGLDIGLYNSWLRVQISDGRGFCTIVKRCTLVSLDFYTDEEFFIDR